MIRQFDEHTQWPDLIRVAHAGLEKDVLLRELSCSSSTVLRWMAGQTRPGPAARSAIKQKLVALLDGRQ